MNETFAGTRTACDGRSLLREPVSQQQIVSRMHHLVFVSKTLFSDSWITEQFYPNWEVFGTNKITIDMKPFGKANVND